MGKGARATGRFRRPRGGPGRTGGEGSRSASENADFLRGPRGGGGNFGLVTSFEFRAHPVGPEVMFCFVAYPGERVGGILRFLDAYMFHAPEEVSPSDGTATYRVVGSTAA